MRKNNLDPEKFLRAMKEVAEDAKKATIELLKSNGDKCYVVSADDYEEVYVNGNITTFCAVGLNGNEVLVVGGTVTSHEDEDGGLHDDPFDSDFQELESVLESSDTPYVYRFVANNIKSGSYTKKQAQLKLLEMEDD